MRKSDAVIGARFGAWTIIGECVRVRDRLGVLCRCDCGTEQLVTLTNLAGRSRRCRSCTDDQRVRGRPISNDSTAIAWAAGLFEGEGSIMLLDRRSRPHPRVSMSSTDLDVLQRYHDVVGRGRIYGPYDKQTSGGKLPRFDWHTSSHRNCREILRAFWPFLGERRRTRAIEVLGEKSTWL